MPNFFAFTGEGVVSGMHPAVLRWLLSVSTRNVGPALTDGDLLISGPDEVLVGQALGWFNLGVSMVAEYTGDRRIEDVEVVVLREEKAPGHKPTLENLPAYLEALTQMVPLWEISEDIRWQRIQENKEVHRKEAAERRAVSEMKKLQKAAIAAGKKAAPKAKGKKKKAKNPLHIYGGVKRAPEKKRRGEEETESEYEEEEDEEEESEAEESEAVESVAEVPAPAALPPAPKKIPEQPAHQLFARPKVTPEPTTAPETPAAVPQPATPERAQRTPSKTPPRPMPTPVDLPDPLAQQAVGSSDPRGAPPPGMTFALPGLPATTEVTPEKATKKRRSKTPARTEEPSTKKPREIPPIQWTTPAGEFSQRLAEAHEGGQRDVRSEQQQPPPPRQPRPGHGHYASDSGRSRGSERDSERERRHREEAYRRERDREDRRAAEQRGSRDGRGSRDERSRSSHHSSRRDVRSPRR